VKTLMVERRFCGPATSANGGYFAGLVAGLSAHTLSVQLRSPPPLDTELAVVDLPEDGLQVRHGEVLVAQASPAELVLQPPPPPDYVSAVEASRNYLGFTHHMFDSCFVCGPHRQRGDGLRVFPGAVPGRDIVAAPWVPDASLDRGDGKVRPEFIAAALDCPGYYAVTPGNIPALLAQFTAHLDRLVHIGESCTVIAWKISANGRKYEAGSAIYDGDGELCGRAKALWVEPRNPSRE
jgi:hypothetical protein